MNIVLSPLENTIRDTAQSTTNGDLIQEAHHAICMNCSNINIHAVWMHVEAVSFSTVKLGICAKYTVPINRIPKRFNKQVLRELLK